MGFSSGRYAIFHCTPAEEVMFHVATMMPTTAGDKIQLNKVNFLNINKVI